MDTKALEAARLALTRAEEALALLSTHPLVSFGNPNVDTPSVWSDILIYGNRVLTKLEQGSKSGPSKGWFDNQKYRRKTDQILAYMLHARNADEHGIQLVYNLDHSHVAIEMPEGLPPGTPIISFIEDESGSTIGVEPASPQVKITSQRNYSFTLREVLDRGIYYQVPTEDLGQPLEGHVVMAVAEAFLAKLRGIVEEASALAAG